MSKPSKSERQELRKRKLQKFERYNMKVKKLQEELNLSSDESDEDLESGEIDPQPRKSSAQTEEYPPAPQVPRHHSTDPNKNLKSGEIDPQPRRSSAQTKEYPPATQMPRHHSTDPNKSTVAVHSSRVVSKEVKNAQPTNSGSQRTVLASKSVETNRNHKIDNYRASSSTMAKPTSKIDQNDVSPEEITRLATPPHANRYLAEAEASTSISNIQSSTSDLAEPQASTSTSNIQSSTSDLAEPQASTSTSNIQSSTSDLAEPQASTSTSNIQSSTSDLAEPQASTSTSNIQSSTSDLAELQARTSASETQGSTSDLDNDLLGVLNEIELSQYGEKIHDKFANLILPIVKKGLEDDKRRRYCNMYLVPDNCRLLQAPALNADVPEVTRYSVNLDGSISDSQQQLGLAITAICRAMDLVSKGVNNKIEIMKHLYNGCIMFADLHYNYFTQTRRKVFLNNINRMSYYYGILRDSESDETLFGKDIMEKIEAEKIKPRRTLPVQSRAPGNPRARKMRNSSADRRQTIGGYEIPRIGQNGRSHPPQSR